MSAHRGMIRALALLVCVTAAAPAAALVGGAAPADGAQARALVVVAGSRGNFCTGTALAPDLVLTAAHCVPPGADYKIAVLRGGGAPQLADVTAVARHPQFDARAFAASRATADVALLKTRVPLPAAVVPTTLGASPKVAAGDRLVVAGLGVSVRGDGKSGGLARAASLVVTGRPGTLQIRLVDPAGRGETPGLGACTGDSGAPVFADAGVIGLVSWSTGPKLSEGCGGMTGVTPLVRYRAWIEETLRRLSR